MVLKTYKKLVMLFKTKRQRGREKSPFFLKNHTKYKNKIETILKENNKKEKGIKIFNNRFNNEKSKNAKYEKEILEYKKKFEDLQNNSVSYDSGPDDNYDDDD